MRNTRTSWKGGHISPVNGYKYIKIDGKEVGEHILVAERIIGRRLQSGEVVHHVNGIRSDNRPDNLQVMTRCEHQKLHGLMRRRVEPCARCGRVLRIYARGLCKSCYGTERIKGKLGQWALSINRKKLLSTV